MSFHSYHVNVALCMAAMFSSLVSKSFLGTARWAPQLRRSMCSSVATSVSEPSALAKAERQRLELAMKEATTRFSAGTLNFDPQSVPPTKVLEWHTLYSTEREAVEYRANLLKFGRKALKQIRENRIPADSKWSSETPAELLEPSVGDDAVISWFSDVVAKFKKSETQALEDFMKPKELTESQKEAKNKLLAYIDENLPGTDTSSLSISELREIKREYETKKRAERSEEVKKLKEEATAVKRIELGRTARKFAHGKHTKGLIPDFDYREANDDAVIDWYLKFKAAAKQKKRPVVRPA